MNNPRAYILFLFLFCYFVDGFAQQESIDSPDSITMAEGPYNTESSFVSSFDSVSLQEPVSVRFVEKEVVDSLKAADDFWYANLDKAKKKKTVVQAQENQKTLFQQRWFRNLLWVVILGSFIAVVFWYLVSSNIFFFRKGAKKINGDGVDEAETDNVFAIDYNKEIATATEAGNYRLAVRLRYLQTLKELANRKLIDYRFGRTNHDYVAQLSKTPHYRNFFRLTRNFEYTWYGQFALSKQAYDMMEADFVHFKNGLS
jgi:hypothetical protein